MANASHSLVSYSTKAMQLVKIFSTFRKGSSGSADLFYVLGERSWIVFIDHLFYQLAVKQQKPDKKSYNLHQTLISIVMSTSEQNQLNLFETQFSFCCNSFDSIEFDVETIKSGHLCWWCLDRGLKIGIARSGSIENLTPFLASKTEKKNAKAVLFANNVPNNLTVKR